MENSRLKLSYFDARGVAETTRYMLAVTKTPYEDFRYGFTFGTPGDFSTVQRPEFDAAKAAGKLDANLGRLPLLEVDGQVFGQSKTIERFVAKRVGMMGANDLEAAQIDCICEHLRDCKDKYMKAKTNPETKAAYFATEMPEFMAKVEKRASGPGSAAASARSPTRPPTSSSRSSSTTSRARPRPSRVAPRSPRRSRPSGSSPRSSPGRSRGRRRCSRCIS